MGGQGCAGSLRLAPVCSVTKGRIVRCREVWIKVSGVGQVGRKTGMSCGLQRANWKGYFHSFEGFLVVDVSGLFNSIIGYFKDGYSGCNSGFWLEKRTSCKNPVACN